MSASVPPPAAMDPRFSVIVPFRDEASYLPRCLDALAAQGFPPAHVELLMVDNASTDGSAAIVAAHPRARLLVEPRPGAYIARNRAAREARGAILAFTDADCAPAPDWLARLDEAFADPAVALVIGERRLAHDERWLDLVVAHESHKAAGLTFGYTNNLAVRREVFARLGPFDEVPRGADTRLFRRVKDALGPAAVRFEPRVSVRHLEVDSVAAHLAKCVVYGWIGARGGARLAVAARVRDLAHAALVRVPASARAIQRTRGLPSADVARLALIGWADLAALHLGRLLARLGVATDRLARL